MEIQGKIIKILEPQTFTSQKNGKTYVTNQFVLETNGQYPKRVAFKVMGDSDERFKQMGIVMGGTYNVSFDVESREWQGKWFTECQAWRTQRVDGTQTQQQPAQAPAQGDGSDNLPF